MVLEKIEQGGVKAETVLKIAALARIELSSEEATAFEWQIGSILEHFRKLADAQMPDNMDVISPLGGEHLLRDDIVTHCSFDEDFLAGVPRRQGDFVVVPDVLPRGSDNATNWEN